MALTASALRTLHRIHQQLGDLRERAERGPKQVRAHEANVKRLEEELATAKSQHKATRVASDQKQLSLKAGEAKIEDLRRKLNACGSNREYQALLEQIAADEMANSVLADEILEAMEKVDEVHGKIGEAEQRLAKGKEELAKTHNSIREQLGQIEVDIKRLEIDLREAEAGLPTDIRSDYDRVVKSRGSEAMAAVEGECCGGCFNTLTPNMFNSLHMSHAVFCKNCGCLLYLPEDRAQSR
ncbi:MAG: zinc ribbon domain-containing protein [Pirellulales bacterium]